MAEQVTLSIAKHDLNDGLYSYKAYFVQKASVV